MVENAAESKRGKSGAGGSNREQKRGFGQFL